MKCPFCQWALRTDNEDLLQASFAVHLAHAHPNDYMVTTQIAPEFSLAINSKHLEFLGFFGGGEQCQNCSAIPATESFDGMQVCTPCAESFEEVAG